MARFFYKAKNKEGQIISRHILAMDISSAAAIVEREGLVLLEIEEEGKVSSQRVTARELSEKIIFSAKEKLEFFNSFLHMYQSGLSILQIFYAVLNSAKNEKIKGLCSIIIKKIEKGCNLEEAFTGYENVLGIAYTKLVVAGEASGKIDKVLKKVVDNIKKEQALKSNLLSSLSYPIMILSLALAVFMLFKFFILKVFAMMGSGICSATVMQLLVFAVVKIFFIFSIIIGSLCFIYFNKPLLKKVIGFFSRLPGINSLYKNYSFANFFSILSLAYDAGVPIFNSIEMATSVIGVPAIKAKLNLAAKRVNNGCEVTTAFAVTQVFSPFAMSQISAGEKAGELEKMFSVVATDYEKKLEFALDMVLQILKPLSIIIVGIFVLYVAKTGYESYYAGLLGGFGL